MQSCRPFVTLSKGGHSAEIVSMSGQLAGSIVVTGSSDHVLRCIDVSAGHCIAAQGLTDKILCVSLHPIALLVLVALRSSLKILEVAMCVASLSFFIILGQACCEYCTHCD
jgi:hypothetical protein